MNASEHTCLELLAALAEISRIRPEWRLGQMIANLATAAGRLDSGGVWDLEDTEALVAAKSLIEQHSECESEAADPDAASDPARDVGFWDFKAHSRGPGT